MASRCNRCGGLPEFQGTLFVRGKVYHRFGCTCGNFEEIEVNPFGYDLDDPRAARTARLTPDYRQRMGM